MHLMPCDLSQKHTLARLVDLPTPLTPMNTIEYGLFCSLARRTSARMSVLRRGVRIRTSASSSAGFTNDRTLVNVASFFPSRVDDTDSHSCSAISIATFFSMSAWRNCAITGARSSFSRALLPVRVLKMLEKNPDFFGAAVEELADGADSSSSSSSSLSLSSASSSPFMYSGPSPTYSLRMPSSLSSALPLSSSAPFAFLARFE
mmetsp:Transcript_4383/g.7680  ORF Transcript_4383/g.7680 Transcript_4383/m.7680 type:complete len:204 (-) Transcript_4383:375-986(-)